MPGHYDSEEFTKTQAVKLKNVNKATSESKNRRTFQLKKSSTGRWFKQYSDGSVDFIKKDLGEKMASAKRNKMPGTGHYTVEYVRMKGVQDPEKVPKGKAREQEIANKQAQKKASNNFQKKQKEVKELIATARKANTSGRIKTDANTPKKPTKTRGLKAKGKAGIALGLASLLGLSMSADKSKKKEEAPKRKKRPSRVPPSKSEGSKNIKQQMDSEEAIKARMQADRNQPVDFKGDYPIYRKDSAPAKSFRKKFNEEKNRLKTQGGSDTFTWQGRKYKIK
tara:strand:- start:966 stop:1805 length:840 start_codon:yes stop_codon:yes gene_type:complete